MQIKKNTTIYYSATKVNYSILWCNVLEEGGQSGHKSQFGSVASFQHLFYFTCKLLFSLLFFDAHLLHLNLHCGVQTSTARAVCPCTPMYCGSTYFQNINETGAHARTLTFTHTPTCLPAWLCNGLFCGAWENPGMVERVLLRPFNSWDTTHSLTPGVISISTAHTHTLTQCEWVGRWWPISLYFLNKLLH